MVTALVILCCLSAATGCSARVLLESNEKEEEDQWNNRIRSAKIDLWSRQAQEQQQSGCHEHRDCSSSAADALYAHPTVTYWQSRIREIEQRLWSQAIEANDRTSNTALSAKLQEDYLTALQQLAHQQRIQSAQLDLWSRGAFDFSITQETFVNNDQSSSISSESSVDVYTQWLEEQVQLAPQRLGPVKNARRALANRKEKYSEESPPLHENDLASWWQLRGGGQPETAQANLESLAKRFGPEFSQAIEQNNKDHEQDCRASCEHFYCASEGTVLPPLDDILNGTTIASYSFGAAPPEDFASDFGFPLDLIKVTQKKALFTADEAKEVILQAEAEGVDKNEYKSGKYKLGGDWLTNLPQTRAWFNRRLETTLFPLLSHLFPEIISSPAVLRAHSVSLLKYNSTHPRTDVHVDNGILAITLAMTPTGQYTGGGTFFEHMGNDHVLEMDVGHVTLRPGSVRHGGHRVQSGTRYILGAFLLLEDRVEHVRRLKNRGAELRAAGDLEQAERHFEWALALNPKCTTCLKDWAEILVSRKEFERAEHKIRAALDILENKDSDALFTLGVLLSEQGKDDESIQAYQQSVALNAEDAELCYNLGIKLGAKGDREAEMKMYERATEADPSFGGAWLNWGTSLAESGKMDDAESKFLKATQCEPEVAPKALINLGLVYHGRANQLAMAGDLSAARETITKAADYLDTAQPLLVASLSTNADAGRYLSQYKPLRLQCHRLLGQIYAGEQNLPACEKEFRSALTSFPNDPGALQALGRILEMQGKTEEAKEIMSQLRRQ